MAIEGYVGRPGSGKTYTIVERAIRERDRGVNVFANFKLEGCWYFTADQLLDLPPGLVVVDEAHLWFSSRAALRLPASWLAGMSQTRKKGWDLLYSTQHESRVDRVLRDVSDWLWLCKAWGFGPKPQLFTATSYEPEYFRDAKRRNVTTYRPFSKRVADAYDTYESLAVAGHTLSADEKFQERVKAAAK